MRRDVIESGSVPTAFPGFGDAASPVVTMVFAGSSGGVAQATVGAAVDSGGPISEPLAVQQAPEVISEAVTRSGSPTAFPGFGDVPVRRPQKVTDQLVRAPQDQLVADLLAQLPVVRDRGGRAVRPGRRVRSANRGSPGRSNSSEDDPDSHRVVAAETAA